MSEKIEKRNQDDFLTIDYLHELMQNPYVNETIKSKIASSIQCNHKLYKVDLIEGFVLYTADDYIKYLNYQRSNYLTTGYIASLLSMMCSFLVFADEQYIKIFGFIFLSLFILCSIGQIFFYKEHKKTIKKVESDNEEYLRLVRQANIRF